MISDRQYPLYNTSLHNIQGFCPVSQILFFNVLFVFVVRYAFLLLLTWHKTTVIPKNQFERSSLFSIICIWDNKTKKTLISSEQNKVCNITSARYILSSFKSLYIMTNELTCKNKYYIQEQWFLTDCSLPRTYQHHIHLSVLANVPHSMSKLRGVAGKTPREIDIRVVQEVKSGSTRLSSYGKETQTNR
jgi:hypothetical protein